MKVTAQGRQVHQRIRAKRTATVSECVAQLPARQADALSRALPALEALAQQLEDRDAPGDR